MTDLCKSKSSPWTFYYVKRTEASVRIFPGHFMWTQTWFHVDELRRWTVVEHFYADWELFCLLLYQLSAINKDLNSEDGSEVRSLLPCKLRTNVWKINAKNRHTRLKTNILVSDNNSQHKYLCTQLRSGNNSVKRKHQQSDNNRRFLWSSCLSLSHVLLLLL